MSYRKDLDKQSLPSHQQQIKKQATDPLSPQPFLFAGGKGERNPDALLLLYCSTAVGNVRWQHIVHILSLAAFVIYRCPVPVDAAHSFSVVVSDHVCACTTNARLAAKSRPEACSVAVKNRLLALVHAILGVFTEHY